CVARARRRFRVGVATFFLAQAFTALSCGRGDAGERPKKAAVVTGGGAADGWGTSACYECLAGDSACRDEIGNCLGDPGCAAWMTCLQHCPVGPEGDVDAACAEGCAPPSGEAGETARTALEKCRTRSGRAACPACGPIECEHIPLLCQTC